MMVKEIHRCSCGRNQDQCFKCKRWFCQFKMHTEYPSSVKGGNQLILLTCYECEAK